MTKRLGMVMYCKVLVVQGVYMEMFQCFMAMKGMEVMLYIKNLAVQGVYMTVKGVCDVQQGRCRTGGLSADV